MNRAGFAHGLSTAPLASRHRWAGGGAVDNPAYWIPNHLIETTFRSDLLPRNLAIDLLKSLDGLSISSLRMSFAAATGGTGWLSPDDAVTVPAHVRKDATFNRVVLRALRHVTECDDSGNVPVPHPTQAD
jgi:hypothetical protein